MVKFLLNGLDLRNLCNSLVPTGDQLERGKASLIGYHVRQLEVIKKVSDSEVFSGNKGSPTVLENGLKFCQS